MIAGSILNFIQKKNSDPTTTMQLSVKDELNALGSNSRKMLTTIILLRWLHIFKKKGTLGASPLLDLNPNWAHLRTIELVLHEQGTRGIYGKQSALENMMDSMPARVQAVRKAKDRNSCSRFTIKMSWSLLKDSLFKLYFTCTLDCFVTKKFGGKVSGWVQVE